MSDKPGEFNAMDPEDDIPIIKGKKEQQEYVRQLLKDGKFQKAEEFARLPAQRASSCLILIDEYKQKQEQPKQVPETQTTSNTLIDTNGSAPPPNSAPTSVSAGSGCLENDGNRVPQGQYPNPPDGQVPITVPQSSTTSALTLDVVQTQGYIVTGNQIWIRKDIPSGTPMDSVIQQVNAFTLRRTYVSKKTAWKDVPDFLHARTIKQKLREDPDMIITKFDEAEDRRATHEQMTKLLDNSSHLDPPIEMMLEGEDLSQIPYKESWLDQRYLDDRFPGYVGHLRPIVNERMLIRHLRDPRPPPFLPTIEPRRRRDKLPSSLSILKMMSSWPNLIYQTSNTTAGRDRIKAFQSSSGPLSSRYQDHILSLACPAPKLRISETAPTRDQANEFDNNMLSLCTHTKDQELRNRYLIAEARTPGLGHFVAGSMGRNAESYYIPPYYEVPKFKLTDQSLDKAYIQTLFTEIPSGFKEFLLLTGTGLRNTSFAQSCKLNDQSAYLQPVVHNTQPKQWNHETYDMFLRGFDMYREIGMKARVGFTDNYGNARPDTASRITLQPTSEVGSRLTSHRRTLSDPTYQLITNQTLPNYHNKRRRLDDGSYELIARKRVTSSRDRGSPIQDVQESQAVPVADRSGGTNQCLAQVNGNEERTHTDRSTDKISSIVPTLPSFDDPVYEDGKFVFRNSNTGRKFVVVTEGQFTDKNLFNLADLQQCIAPIAYLASLGITDRDTQQRMRNFFDPAALGKLFPLYFVNTSHEIQGKAPVRKNVPRGESGVPLRAREAETKSNNPRSILNNLKKNEKNYRITADAWQEAADTLHDLRNRLDAAIRQKAIDPHLLNQCKLMQDRPYVIDSILDTDELRTRSQEDFMTIVSWIRQKMIDDAERARQQLHWVYSKCAAENDLRRKLVAILSNILNGLSQILEKDDALASAAVPAWAVLKTSDLISSLEALLIQLVPHDKELDSVVIDITTREPPATENSDAESIHEGPQRRNAETRSIPDSPEQITTFIGETHNSDTEMTLDTDSPGGDHVSVVQQAQAISRDKLKLEIETERRRHNKMIEYLRRSHSDFEAVNNLDGFAAHLKMMSQAGLTTTALADIQQFYCRTYEATPDVNGEHQMQSYDKVCFDYQRRLEVAETIWGLRGGKEGQKRQHDLKKWRYASHDTDGASTNENPGSGQTQSGVLMSAQPVSLDWAAQAALAEERAARNLEENYICYRREKDRPEEKDVVNLCEELIRRDSKDCTVDKTTEEYMQAALDILWKVSRRPKEEYLNMQTDLIPAMPPAVAEVICNQAMWSKFACEYPLKEYRRPLAQRWERDGGREEWEWKCMEFSLRPIKEQVLEAQRIRSLIFDSEETTEDISKFTEYEGPYHPYLEPVEARVLSAELRFEPL